MTRVMRHPMLSAFLLGMWLLLNQSVTPGHIFLGSMLGIAGGLALSALQIPTSRVHRSTPAGYVLRSRPASWTPSGSSELVARGARGRSTAASRSRRRRGCARRSRCGAGPLSDRVASRSPPAEIRRLEELRVDGARGRVDAELAAGRHREVLGEIEALAVEHPLREPSTPAHARAVPLRPPGRRAGRLPRGARAARGRESAWSPAPELRRLHEAILRQDPPLDLAAGPSCRASSTPRRRRRSTAATRELAAARALGAGARRERQARRSAAAGHRQDAAGGGVRR